ncbi:2-oxo-4-hydroxy-4-carboxy-5-ureidoimidazoline decarboxylase [Pantoea ananatis]|uniref:2-oxo-4-hydroxy-4-carboxy-5-ureidoimidazoline decarboxylase n=1 Tax=Pantoea ananas TaxID=553 RepID=UPI0019802F67|nr:2-oxo-4-hydroxy-4-carboxy-5-ureidoimidazoline decarboxylase [Pantoea ananatis]MBN6031401.1 2-oxo-4-hydroxy-4-carboxy-5-ureidoimidazoline decarboxylase [Pantoea ananatis]
MDLDTFNQLPDAAAQLALSHCVALPHWQQALVAARPFHSLDALLTEAHQLTQDWQEDDLNQALSAHPRIGEKAQGDEKEKQLSRSEQSAMQQADDALQQAMVQGNQAYEARFNRVFLIRAKGRSAQNLLDELTRRLDNSPESEQQEALAQLREITLLRLKESFS